MATTRSDTTETASRTRTRLTATLFAGAALGSTAHIAAVTIAVLAVVEVTGNSALAGTPGAAGVLGTALGSLLLTRKLGRGRRRPGLILGYSTGVIGNLIAIGGLAALSLPLLLLGAFTSGFANACNNLTRYTAADMHPAGRRGTVLGIIVWAATIGSVVGPVLLAPFGNLAESLDRSELAGGFIVGAVFMAAAALLHLFALRPDPASFFDDAHSDSPDPAMTAPAESSVVQARIGATAMTAAQIIMVVIMTATPLHIHHHGAGLGSVGVVMMAHTLGMFGFSPLVGRWTDRTGGFAIMATGLGVIGVSALATAVVAEPGMALLVGSLFILGLGWSMAFVAGSSILTRSHAAEARTRRQGRVDAMIWVSAGAASVLSGFLFESAGFWMTGVVGLILLAAAIVGIVWQRRRLPDLATISG